MTAAESIDIIEKYIKCCLIKGSCMDCPFYEEKDKDWLKGKCLGTKEYGNIMLSILNDIRAELK